MTTSNNTGAHSTDSSETERLKEQIIYIVEDTLYARRMPKLTDNLQKDLNMDSLDAVELTLAIEERFNRDLNLEEAFRVEKIKTVKDLVDYVEKALYPQEEKVVAHQGPKSFWAYLFGAKHQKQNNN